MLKTLTMALVRCPIGFSEEMIIALFQKFLRIFCQIIDRLRGLECFKGSVKKKVGCQVVFYEEIIAMF